MKRYCSTPRNVATSSAAEPRPRTLSYSTAPSKDDIKAIPRTYPGRITYFGEECDGLLFLRLFHPTLDGLHRRLFLQFCKLCVDMSLGEQCHASGTIGVPAGRKEEAGRFLASRLIRPVPTALIILPWSWILGPASLVCGCIKIETGGLTIPPGNRRGEVRVVITIKADLAAHEVVIEKWCRSHRDIPSQTITIRQARLPPRFHLRYWNDWVVVGGPLVVSFEDILLRGPRGGSEEKDFVIPDYELAKLAIQCFRDNHTRAPDADKDGDT